MEVRGRDRIGQREMLAMMKASGDPKGSSGAGMVLQGCPELGQKAGSLCP